MYEKTHETTGAQINQIEQQIYSIEAANINQETLKAMQNAGAAMKQIHGGLTIDKVDATMDELREQHALGEEIANAITNAPLGEAIDEGDLEDELEELEQEALDERMIKTGTVPVTGELDKMPAVSTGPGKEQTMSILYGNFGNADRCFCSAGPPSTGRRRGGRVTEVTGRDGYVTRLSFPMIRAIRLPGLISMRLTFVTSWNPLSAGVLIGLVRETCIQCSAGGQG